MKRKSSDYRNEAKAAPFELELDGGGTVVFRDPNTMTSEDAFQAAETGDPKKALRLLLGDDWVVFWAEWGARPIRELIAVQKDVNEHYNAGGIARLDDLVDRYGEAIEADLHRFYSVDLLDVYRDRLSARKVCNLVDHLPRDSAYGQALADDEELARFAGGQPPREAGSAVSEWSATVELLAAIFDRLGGMDAQMRAMATRKKQKGPKAWPRPVTAAERVAAVRKRASWEHVMRQILPGDSQPPV